MISELIERQPPGTVLYLPEALAAQLETDWHWQEWYTLSEHPLPGEIGVLNNVRVVVCYSVEG